MAPQFIYIGGQRYFLDELPSMAASAWSVRRLTASYTGPAIRIRRSQDSVETDIGFTSSGDLDTAAIQTFLTATSQNLLLNSESINDATWLKTNVTVLTNNTTDPLGGSTAERITETTANASHGFSQQGMTNYTIKGCTYIFSIYAKENTVGWFQLLAGAGSFGVNQWVNFDAGTGAIGSMGSEMSLSDCTSTSIGSGWYRFSAKFVCNGESSNNPYYIRLLKDFDDPTRTPAYVGATSRSMWFWGGQMEGATTVGSYRGTTSLPFGLGYVTTMYDQSGNGIDLTSTTASQQPVIGLGDQIYTCNGKPGVFFQGGQRLLANNTAADWTKYHDGTIQWSHYQVVQAGVTSNPNNIYRFWTTSAGSSTYAGLVHAYADRTASSENDRLSLVITRAVSSSFASLQQANNTLLPNQQNIIFGNMDPANATAALRSEAAVNNAADITANALTNAVSSADPFSAMIYGDLNTTNLPMIGFLQELAFWDVPNVKNDVFTKSNSYWGAY